MSWPDGTKYVGEFKDDKFNGQGTYTQPDGTKYVGEFKDDLFNGQGTYTEPSGYKYVGEFKDDKFNGQGTFTYPDGTKYVGEFKDDKFNGQGTYTEPSGAILAGVWFDDELVQEKPIGTNEIEESNETSPTARASSQVNSDTLLMSSGGIALHSTERSDKWLLTFKEPIFRTWLFGSPQIKSNTAGTTEIVGYGPRQQGEMFYNSAVAYEQLQRLRRVHRSTQSGTRSYETAYKELRDFEKSEFLLGDIYDNDEKKYVRYDWAAYKFTADELLRRYSRNVVKDWVCYYSGSMAEQLDDDFPPSIDCQAFVFVERCQAPKARWNDEDDWKRIECEREDYVPIGRHEHLGGKILLVQSSYTRLHLNDQWSDARLYNGDIVKFSGLMHCLDIDYKNCHVKATDIEVIPSE